jgi:hypothetical protein
MHVGLKTIGNTSLKELGININENRFDEEFSRIFLKNLNSLK